MDPIHPSTNVENRKKENISTSTAVPSPVAGVAKMTSDSAPDSRSAAVTSINRPQPYGRRPNESWSRQADISVTDTQVGMHASLPSVATAAAAARSSPCDLASGTNWKVEDGGVRHVPSYYPLEKTSRFVSGVRPSEIANRISDCCRIMSVQASFDNNSATAELRTSEHVEMHISLWHADDHPDCTIVEAQRRKGCSLTYHKYCRNLLDAAEGEFDANRYEIREEARLREVIQSEELVSNKSESENSLLALEIAASLLKKDRMDCRQIGMESLCLLTDPSKAGMKTALFASRAVLFGTIQEESMDNDEFLPEDLGVREAVLSLVQFGRIGDGGDFKEANDSDSEDEVDDDVEFNSLLHNLALAVLANALDVLENHGTTLSPKEDLKPSAVANEFLEETIKISKRELLSTLLNVLGKAESKPHDAYLSAQCLRSLFQASKKARHKARDMNAKEIVTTALDVGRRTHVKLQTETENVMRELEKVEDDQEEEEEEEQSEES